GARFVVRLRHATGVAVRPLRRVEDDDVTAVGTAEVVGEPAHEHALANVEGGLHRLARDAVRLDEERLDQERHADRHGDDHDQLDDRVLPDPADQVPGARGQADWSSSFFGSSGWLSSADGSSSAGSGSSGGAASSAGTSTSSATASSGASTASS